MRVDIQWKYEIYEVGQYCRTHSNHESCAAIITVLHSSTLLINIIICTLYIIRQIIMLTEQKESADHNNNNNLIDPQTSLSHSVDQMSLRINADNSRPRDVLCFWLIFLITIGLCFLLAALFAPHEIIIKTNISELSDTLDHSCMNPCGFQNNTLICNPFGKHNPNLGLVLRRVSVLNQFALVYVQFDQNKLSVSDSTASHQLTQQIQVKLFSMKLVTQNKTGRFIKNKELGDRNIELSDQNQTDSFTFYGQKIQHLLGFYREVNEENYLLVVKFSNVQQIIKNSLNPVIKAIMINPNFSIFLILVRSIGFLVTLFTGMLYLRNYLRIPDSQRSIQQRLVLVMSILILLFNDPLYSLSIVKPTIVLSIISVLFLSQFIVFLLFFWDFVVLRIYLEQGQLQSKLINWKTILFALLYFGVYFVFISWHFSDMAVAAYEGHFILDPKIFSQNLSVAFLLWLIVNLTVYAFISIRALQQDKVVLMWRSRSWIFFNVYFAVLLQIFMIVTGSKFQENSKLLLITYVSLNLYCVYMQYMFSASFVQKQRNNLIPVSTQVSELQTMEGETVIDMGAFPKNIKSSNTINSD